MISIRRHPDPGGRLRVITLVECLIGLAISAVLLTAVRRPSTPPWSTTAKTADVLSMNNARQALTRMAARFDPAGYFDQAAVRRGLGWSIMPLPPDHCTFYLANHELLPISSNSAEKKLYLVKNATGQSYVLCNNVTNAVFTTMPNSGGGTEASVIITLTVREGGTETHPSAAAALRRFPPASCDHILSLLNISLAVWLLDRAYYLQTDDGRG